MATTVLITGAAGNLGGKLRRHLEGQGGRWSLRLLDRQPADDPAVWHADLSAWGGWADCFRGADAVVHLAADPTAQRDWPGVVGPNVDAVVNTFQAAVQAGVRRVVFASSNHVMGGYKDRPDPDRITTDLPPAPGTRYAVSGEQRDSSAYGSAKLFGERLGRCLSDIHGVEFIAVRLGWCRQGDNRAADVPLDREWFRLMWLSNRDYADLMERCLVAPLPRRFVVVNGMSANTGMRWDIEATREVLGYEPQDDVTRP